MTGGVRVRLFALPLLAAVLAVAMQGASLSGKVVEDHTGAPLASVDVMLSKTGQPRLVADLETDASGHFTVPGLTPGEYHLALTKPNCLGVTLTFQITSDTDVVAHQFRMVRGSSISGVATDAQGRPIQGGFVYAMAKPAEGDSFRPMARVPDGAASMMPVDGTGHFRLYNLPPGQYAIALAWGATRQHAAQSGGGSALPGLGTGVQFYPSNSAPSLFTITGGEQLQANFLVNPGPVFNVSGKVDREMKPNEGNFWLALIQPEQPGLAIASAQTERGGGTFKFEGIPAGTYDLLAGGPSKGYNGTGSLVDSTALFSRTRVTVSGQNVENLVVSPVEGRSASFVLKRTDPACPDVAELTLTSLEDWTVVLTATKSIGAKAQAIEHLAPGRYRATAAVSGNACFATPRTVTVGDDAAVNEIAVSLAGGIHGNITGVTEPTQFLAMLTDPEAPNDSVRVVPVDAHGGFEFSGLRPGRYHVLFVPADEASRFRWSGTGGSGTNIEVTAGAPVTISLLIPKVSGQ